MRRILFLLTLVCGFALNADATAQQCCSRRPVLNCGSCTSTCSTGMLSSQSTGMTFSSSPMVVYQTSYSATTPNTSSPFCCGSTTAMTPQSPASFVLNASTSTPQTIPASPVSTGVDDGIVASSVPAPVVSNTNLVGNSYYMPTYTQTSMRVSQYRSPIANGTLAQRKAERAAQLRMRGHLGGSLGGARYEGVGWSNVSPQLAIQSCCYWGQRPASQIGVARGSDGMWYACVLYR